MTPSTTPLEKGGGSGNTFMLKYCRMCALELKQGVFIFGEEGKRLQIPEKIRKTVSILVLEEDSLPKKICTDCCSSLEDYSQYKDTVLDAQEKLTSIARNLERSQEHSMLQIQAQQNIQANKSKSQPRKHFVQAPSSLSQCISPDIPPIEDSTEDPTIFSEDLTENQDNEESPGSPQVDRDDVSIINSPDPIETPKNVEIGGKDEGEVEAVQSFEAPSSSSYSCDKQLQQELEGKDDQNLQCGICGKSMKTRIELENHHKKSHDLGKYSAPIFGCSLCSRVSENYNAIRIHIYRHRNEGNFKCSECQKMFPVKDQLDRHMLAVHNGGLKAFPCKICGKRFAANCSLVVHMTSKHPSLPKEKELDNTTDKSKFSSNSNNPPDFKSNRNLTIHSPEKANGANGNEIQIQVKNSPDKNLQSESSPADVSTSDNIVGEKDIGTGSSKPTKNVRKKFKNDGNSDNGIWRCEYCDKIHQTLAGYQSHVATHKGRRFACELCSAVFTQKASLSHHITTQHSHALKEFRCTVCSKEFKTSKHMKMHMQFHSEPDSKETCSVCQKVYKSKAHLKSHMKTHKSQKNFMCSICQKAFATQSKLNDHKNSHTGARPYKCSYCEYTASHVGQFYKHKNTHRKEIQHGESKSAFNDQVKEPHPHANSLEPNSSSTAMDISTDLSTKSPQKIHQVHSALSNNGSAVNATNLTNTNNHQSSFSSQQSATQSQAIVASSNTEGIHSSSQVYSHNSHSQQIWTSSNGTIQSGRAYQSTEGASSSGGLNGVDLVNCAIQHTLTSEDLSSHSHSTSHILNYSPNNQSSSSHIVHTNHNNNNSLSNFVSTSSPITSNGNNNSSTISVASLSASHSQPHQSEPMELSYKLQIESNEFQDMPMELTKVFQRDPLELCVRQDFNPLMDLSSRVGNGTDPNGMNMNSMSMNMTMSNNGMSNGMNGMGMGYHKLDITERELSFNDLSGAFRQPIDLIARTDDTSHELCSEGSLVDLSLRSSFVQDQSASSFLRELIDLSARSDSFHGELNLTNKQHHQTSHTHMHQGSNNHSGGMNKHTSGNGNHHQHHGHGAGTLQNVIYQDAMFSLQN